MSFRCFFVSAAFLVIAAVLGRDALSQFGQSLLGTCYCLASVICALGQWRSQNLLWRVRSSGGGI